jgi:hypothetical protein
VRARSEFCSSYFGAAHMKQFVNRVLPFVKHKKQVTAARVCTCLLCMALSGADHLWTTALSRQHFRVAAADNLLALHSVAPQVLPP